jgi:hypothetical protein
MASADPAEALSLVSYWFDQSEVEAILLLRLLLAVRLPSIDDCIIFLLIFFVVFDDDTFHNRRRCRERHQSDGF